MMEEIRDTAKNVTNEPMSGFFRTMEELSPNAYYGLMAASVLLSLSLFFSGRKWGSLFVGLWAPTILSSALFYKLLHPSR